MKKPHIFVISGPSAVGKTSVVNDILRRDRTLSRVVTCTTRQKRDSEKEGVDYFFLSKEKFLREIKEKKLIEFSQIYGNYYGVTFSALMEKINTAQDAILVVNWEGFLKIKEVTIGNVYGIFILPPSIEDLEARIKSRGEDSSEAISQRIGLAREEIDMARHFDFCFKNVDITSIAEDIVKKINEIRYGTQ
ncbi:MAG: guanylate kinase [Holosporaceae bacterium]|nr:guanylate kinase [Holosporaceae bacterium]